MTALTLNARVARVSRELKLFAIASLAMGVAYSLIDSILNNYLNERFTLSGFERSFLEFPRELPGFLVVFISALLWFLSSQRLGAVSMILGLAGTVLVGFFSPTYAILVACLFIYSLGQHLYMPVASTIGMELAAKGQTGRRLGQLNAIRNMAAIAGSGLVFLGFKFMGFTFKHIFVVAAVGFVAAAVLLFALKPEKTTAPKTFLKLHREYNLFYILNILSGSRKQFFITFAPWVIVNIFRQPTQTIATLMTVGGVIGILFQPLLGWAIDRFGERVVLASEAVLLMVVCIGYGFAKSVFSESTALAIIIGCYLVDQMLMSVGMARSTYIKKIALQPADVQPALTAAVTIDHVFSIGVALLGGVIWNAFGFQYVFLLGVVIAMINFVATLQVRIPKQV
jgi:predicted MFS family arabinose efflux permease